MITYTTTDCSNSWVVVVFTHTYTTRREQEQRIREMDILPSLLKTWRIWTNWKCQIPMVLNMLLPSYELVLLPVRPRTRERRHVPGHSPRRR